MKFSVIVPTYNRRALLEETLASVLAQTYADFELIVIDDGSSDGTPEALALLGSRVAVFRQANRGPGEARNLGARHARGDYLAFLDSDDLWFPWTLATYAAVLTATGLPAFLAGKPQIFGDGRRPEPVLDLAPASARFDDYLASGEVWRWWGASSFVVARAAFERAGGFSEGQINFEDADLALKLGTGPGFVQVTAPVTFGYRAHAGNVTGTIAKSVAGARLIVDSEHAARYPGGPSRARERRRIITRHIRSAILEAMRSGYRIEALRLYARSWFWNLGEHRLRFLAAVPLMAVLPPRAFGRLLAGGATEAT